MRAGPGPAPGARTLIPAGSAPHQIRPRGGLRRRDAPCGQRPAAGRRSGAYDEPLLSRATPAPRHPSPPAGVGFASRRDAGGVRQAVPRPGHASIGAGALRARPGPAAVTQIAAAFAAVALAISVMFSAALTLAASVRCAPRLPARFGIEPVRAGCGQSWV